MPVNIHHTHKKQAEKIGAILEEHGGFIRAFWPMQNVAVFAQDAKYAVQQMAAVQKLIRMGEEKERIIKVQSDITAPTMVHITIDNELYSQHPKTPVMWLEDKALIAALDRDDKPLWAPPGMTQDPEHTTTETEDENEAAPDAKPVDEENKEAAQEEEAKEPGKSVVKPEYRTRYAEKGHPAHCGDELAVLLNNLTKLKHTNLDHFRQICEANGVDLSKLKTTGNGWQGRYRMTGRNMLAKQVYSNGGTLKMPEGWGVEDFHLSADWLGTQRFAK